jgi:hypothetical protein
MSALKQTDVFGSSLKHHRAVASEIADSTSRSKTAASVAGRQDHSDQQKTVVQKKSGQDNESPLQDRFINNVRNNQSQAFQPLQNRVNRTGLPDGLKNGLEATSGFDLNDVRVHYNSSRPAQLNAFAYAQGNDIHLGPGQEKHLPHEGWHVVQQRQGRVAPTRQMKGGPAINEDASLEKEADQMGDAIAKGIIQQQSFPGGSFASANPVQQKVIQRLKKVPTNFGVFETTKFADAEHRGVEITLLFNPDKSKVDAKKIALSQSVKTTMSNGNAYAIDPNSNDRMVKSGKQGEGYYTDQLSDVNNPIYSQDANLGATDKLKDTPQSANKSADPTVLGTNTNYQLGQCSKVNPGDADKKVTPAGLWDKPRGGGKKGESKMFETTAFAIEGVDTDKYYGSVKWGFKMEGTDAAPTVTPIDIEEASKGTPTANFLEPAKLWNSGKTRGTLKVIADPEATVLKGNGSGTEKLAKDKKLKQLSTANWGNDPAINAEVLNADGTGSGKIIYIKNVDVRDQGDGSANKPLPV